MAKAKQASVAPKERINIVYKPATGGAKEQVELPLKVLLTGDFTKTDDERSVEDRTPVDINKNNFNEVMASMNLSLSFSVTDHLSGESKKEIDVALQLNEIADFSPDKIVKVVPELQKVMELRDGLKALKGPIGNVPMMRNAIQEVLQDKDARARLMKELKLPKG